MRPACTALATLLLLASSISPLRAQSLSGTDADIPPPESLVRVEAPALEIPAGGHGTARVRLLIQAGWHANANPPALDYLIPTEVVLTGVTGLRPGRPVYPAPHKAKLAFEETELLVYDGEAVVNVPVAVTARTAPGQITLQGQVRYQACNDQVCLAPATLPFQLQVTVTPAAPGTDTTAADTLAEAQPPVEDAAPGDGFMTAPPAAGGAAAATVRQRLEAAFASGGPAWLLVLFVGGLLLNLTPCVFPMLGVTVSIFGARRQEPLPRVMGAALLYVLGIAVMYSTLGVIAALTGGLFGSVLQSAWVNVGLGALLLVLSLSMFGLYELQPPAWLLLRLGGTRTTDALGLFVSGLAVGIIAAPCVGPFVVAVLALIAQRGEPWFGFQTMFALSIGLGFPYLVLASFSNLLQSLPRSGEWMMWVKKVFGVLLIGLGVFYVLVGLAPEWAVWVVPATLILGGIYLGFVAAIANDKIPFRNFRWALGALAVIAGIAVIVTTPRASVRFQPFDPAVLQSGLADGKVAFLDFSAEWCAPCHELDRVTFTDARVIARARSFLALKVDLTRLNSPENERLRREYRIAGVPTLMFLGPDGKEIPDTRVEGFIAPDLLLGLMDKVQGVLEDSQAASSQ